MAYNEVSIKEHWRMWLPQRGSAKALSTGGGRGPVGRGGWELSGS